MTNDIIQNSHYTPTYAEISNTIAGAGRICWDDLNGYLQKEYKSTPKMAFSKCSLKPGWNVKYRKSGKSLCTLYPEKDGFTALVVIPAALGPVVTGTLAGFTTEVVEMVNTVKPLNGTLWLMLPVHDDKMLDDVKQLLSLKGV